jgi:nucleoside 2-deoxyribosyltransferase
MRIYLAARYGRREEMESYAKLLAEDGHEITATWVYGGEEGLSEADIAQLDYKDVERSNLVVGFTDPFGSSNTGGARHFELGLGFALGAATYIVGEREIVFHHLPEIEQFDTFEEFRKEILPYV